MNTVGWERGNGGPSWRLSKLPFGVLEGLNRTDGGEAIMKEITKGKFPQL